MSNILQHLAEAHQAHAPRGIYSVCSAHPWVLEAAFEQAAGDGSDLLIEATSNQVNHLGGYTGMLPDEFRQLVLDIAARKNFDTSRLILGGDHLGPNPWQKEEASVAMEKAELTVEAYVRAGFQKIHLDASMACGGDPHALSGETIAIRAAALCAAAERACGEVKPLYIIGTEVPTPGGATESLQELAVTSREAAAETLATHRRIFEGAGLKAVWPRVIALVVQPGVEFNHDHVVDYDPSKSTHLTDLLKEEKGLVFEAHSTDYQLPGAYRRLVLDGFAILKVGPALTYAMREALTNLAQIEAELIPRTECSHLVDVLEMVMLEKPANWQAHYQGDEYIASLLRRYSYSDRVRYYWHEPRVREAVDVLLSNLEKTGIPETLLSCFLPDEYRAVRAGTLQSNAKSLVVHRIRGVLEPYAAACRNQ